MYNKVILMGRICNNLELKTTLNGTNYVAFRLAVERSYQVKGEEKKVDFFNIVAWRSNAEFICRYFSKGRMILAEGELQTRQYVDKNGSTQNVVEMIVSNVRFTGERKETENTNNVPSSPISQPLGTNTSSASAPYACTEDFTEAAVDDDYPF